MKRILLVLCALAVVPLAPHAAGASRAAAPSGFTFHGSGYGHGIGMSQYGALGLARRGWSPEQIVRHYYTGVKVGERRPADETIRVGLLQNVGSVRLLAAKGGYDLVLANGEAVESVPDGSRRTVEVASDGSYRVERPDGEAVGGRTWGGPGNDLLVRWAAGSLVRVAEWGHTVGRGELRFLSAGSGRAHLIAAMGVEDYLLGLAEVPSSWPKEALGAQAIAGRTYAYWRLAGALRPGCGCDVYGTTADQYYTGWDKESATGGTRWAAAVADTARVVVTYNGDPIYAVYSSSSGGYTENIELVWPGAQSLGYLRGVCDPADDVEDNPSRLWSVAVDPARVTEGLKPYTGDIGHVTGFADFQRGVSGRVTYVRVVGSKGSKVIEGWDVRSGLSLKDTRFAVNRNLNITGPIREAYDRLRCAPGRATTQQKSLKRGRWQGFANGRMYEHSKRGRVTWLRGRLLRAYLEAGGPKGRLRLPYKVRKVRGGGQRAWFDGGSIRCRKGCDVRFAKG